VIASIKKDLEIIYENNPKRLKHIYGVKETAVALAKIHLVDEDKVIIAALLHDITKLEPLSFHKREILNCYNESILKEYSPPTYHGFSAACVAKNKYLIKDDDILNAIESHTVGKPNMTLLEKIIFISDYIEPNREYASCKRVRPIAFENINRAVYEALNDSIKLYESKNHKIPTIAYEARDFYKNLGGNYGKNTSH